MIRGTNRLLALLAFIVTASAASTVSAQEDSIVTFSTQTASVTYGPYARLSFGSSASSYDDGRWQNGGGDPTIFFDLGDETGGFGEIAFGFDWQNGFRGELALGRFGDTNAVGACSSVSDLTPCNDHADISSGSVSSTVVMGNVYYAPFEHRGNNSVFQPFLVAGVGFSRNEVSEWTRMANPGSPSGRLYRSFEGNTDTSFAWSLGLGAAWQISRPGQHPVIIEASWRYFDLGEASGGSMPLPGNGAGDPVVPLTFENTRQVFSLGIRIPLQRL